MSTAKDKFLSASRIKTLETCSWVYWCKYHLHLPDKSNSGALRGTVCHSVFEFLLKKRHKKHYDAILERNSIEGSEAVVRYVHHYLQKCNIENFGNETYQENYDLIDDMIVVGLKTDFFGDESEIYSDPYIEKPEQEFEITNRKPKYKIRGFIDKPIQYKDKKIIRIVDYKSSKYKFRGEELSSNVQAMMYSLAALKIWPKLKPVVEFLILRFPKQPTQQLEFSKEQLKGFEYYLEQVFNAINNFSEKDSVSNFAFDGGFKTKWMCGPTKKTGWECPLKHPYEYYVLKNNRGKVIKSSLEDDLVIEKKGQKIEKLQYEGCPKFNPSQKVGGLNHQDQNDPFDW